MPAYVEELPRYGRSSRRPARRGWDAWLGLGGKAKEDDAVRGGGWRWIVVVCVVLALVWLAGGFERRPPAEVATDRAEGGGGKGGLQGAGVGAPAAGDEVPLAASPPEAEADVVVERVGRGSRHAEGAQDGPAKVPDEAEAVPRDARGQKDDPREDGDEAGREPPPADAPDADSEPVVVRQPEPLGEEPADEEPPIEQPAKPEPPPADRTDPGDPTPDSPDPPQPPDSAHAKPRPPAAQDRPVPPAPPQFYASEPTSSGPYLYTGPPNPHRIALAPTRAIPEDKEGADAVRRMVRRAWKGYWDLCVAPHLVKPNGTARPVPLREVVAASRLQAAAREYDEARPAIGRCHDWAPLPANQDDGDGGVEGGSGSAERRPRLRTNSMALTAVDSLSTLFLLGLKAEYAQALAMVLSWDFAVDHPVSVFETTIRVLGGLLSAWALTGDRELVEQAEGVGKKLLGAFGWQESWETRDKWDWQLPLGTVNLRTGQGSAHNDLGPHQVRIAELGTLQLEFDLLADALPEHRAAPYRSLVTFINRQIRLLETRLAVPGLWPKRLRRTVVSGPGRPGELMEHSYSVGGEVDSFYEYLLKMWVAGGGAAPGRRVEPDVAPADDLEEPAEPTGVGARDWARRMWDRSAAAMQRLMLARVVPHNRTAAARPAPYRPAGHEGAMEPPEFHAFFFPSSAQGARGQVMEHLACFAPGMFALGAATWPYPDGGARGEMWDWAVDSADTCFRSYWDSPTGLGCEAVSVRETPMRPMGGAYYLLRPEVLESVYYLHRLSGGADGRYRRWARFAVAALEAHAAVPSGGYTGLQDVARDPAHGVSRTETQETFFLAETLKYLWLTFASSDALDLSEWVFNTEAHPLPVRGGRRWAELMGGVGAAGKAGTAREVGAKIGARKGARKRPGVREERGRKERARERLAKLGKGKGKMGKAKARKAMRAQARNG